MFLFFLAVYEKSSPASELMEHFWAFVSEHNKGNGGTKWRRVSPTGHTAPALRLRLPSIVAHDFVKHAELCQVLYKLFPRLP